MDLHVDGHSVCLFSVPKDTFDAEPQSPGKRALKRREKEKKRDKKAVPAETPKLQPNGFKTADTALPSGKRKMPSGPDSILDSPVSCG